MEEKDLPADNEGDVLVQLKPRRKGEKPRFAIAIYFSGACDTDEPGWFTPDSEKVEVVRWWPISHVIERDPTNVPLPTTVDMARGMVMLGHNYLQESAPGQLTKSFQDRVQPWMMECFGPMIAGDKEERSHRFFEEATELVQACGMPAQDAHALVDYVYGRPVGEKGQEVGGAMVTLAALCLAQGLDMHAEAETELARIWTKVPQIRAKQASKPKGSALPIPVSPKHVEPDAS